MHSAQIFDDRPANPEGSDVDDMCENDTSDLSEQSLGHAESGHGSEILFTIFRHPAAGKAKLPLNLIALLAHSLSKQN